jgi:hypothetical protein
MWRIVVGLTAVFDRSRFALPHIQNRIEADKRRERQFVRDREDRQKREEKLARAEDDVQAFAGAVGMELASAERLAAFEADPDTYDTAVVTALMENNRQREALQAQIDAMLAQAYITEDGTRAFRTEDGTQVFDERGNDITDHVDPAITGDTGPSWEDFNALRQEQAALEAERSAILDYQQRLVVRFRHLALIFACPRPNVEISRTTRNDKFLVAFLNLTFARRDCGTWDTNVKFTPLDEAREAVASGTMTEAELDEFEAELRETMPGAVRAQLPGDHPAAAVEQTAEVEQSHQMPSLDGLGGFSMPTMGG